MDVEGAAFEFWIGRHRRVFGRRGRSIYVVANLCFGSLWLYLASRTESDQSRRPRLVLGLCLHLCRNSRCYALRRRPSVRPIVLKRKGVRRQAPHLRTFARPVRTDCMKNVQIIDVASNATYSLFQATDDEFASIFPEGREMETIEDLIDRIGDEEATRVLTPLWSRPVLKREAAGLHGTLFYQNEHRQLPASKREVDWDDRSINPAQRELFSRHRE